MPPTNPSSICEITESIAKLRQMTQLNVQANWRYCTEDLPVVRATQPQQWLNWPVAQLNAKEHIAWPAGRQVIWLAQQVTIPQALHHYPLEGLTLRLALTWWAEDALIFVNGELVQHGDLFDCAPRVLLTPAVVPGEVITVAMRLVSPGHDAGALVRSLFVYETTDCDRLDPGFVADELAVLYTYLSSVEPDSESQIQELKFQIESIDWTALPDALAFERSLASLRQTLQDRISFPKSQIFLVGHAHLDLAWLWPVSETWEAAQRTFGSALQLMQEYLELTFCHSTPALYAWIEQYRPDLFAGIQEQVAAGHWEVVGGLWVEPELNSIAGESIVRQILYGQRYYEKKFGQVSPVAWLPDSFGFCWQLPQFFKQGGIEYFVTQKLRWNDSTQFPYGFFWWQAPDGTQIFSLMSAAIGEGIDPIKMANYACEWKVQTGSSKSLWLPGVGDRGGGPTRDMLEIARRWQKSPFFPHLEFTTTGEYLSTIGDRSSLAKDEEQRTIPVWNDELYLEFHRGCYTSHADQKRWNRQCEGLLYEAELFASLATLATGAAYPKLELEEAWKKVLFNQFHDILPGSSIPEVYVDADRGWREVEEVGTEILERALEAIAEQITLPLPGFVEMGLFLSLQPIIIFNSLNWERSQVVAVPLPTLPALDRGAEARQEWQIYDLEGQKLPSQLSDSTTLLFLATDIPAIGYRLFWLGCQLSDAGVSEKSTEKGHISTSIQSDELFFAGKKSLLAKDWILENELLRVTVDSETGNLSSILDKVHNREILSEAGGNQLQAFQDSGQYWDAWNIDPNYARHPLPAPVLKDIQLLENGSVQWRLRVVRQLGASEFVQDYILQAGSPLLKIDTTVDWQERHVLVKAAFPLNLEADYATYEIPCGAIARSTKPQTPVEKAKWEVPALRWADLTQRGNEEEDQLIPIPDSQSSIYGVSLLNDCKYGYDARASELRLTLLRSPSWPDPQSDRGYHKFTYAVYPHTGSWKSAGTVRRGYELNLPFKVKLMPSVVSAKSGNLAPVGQFLNFSSEHLILMAFKQSEDESDRWIVRCYECHGEEAQLTLKSDLELAIAQPVDLLERSLNGVEPSSNRQTFNISPWKIVSFTIQAPTHLKP